MIRGIIRRLKGKLGRYIDYAVGAAIDARLRKAGQVPSSDYDAYLQYLYYEVSELRSLVRYLVADRIDELPYHSQTMASFNSQWGDLPEGKWMLSNPEFRAQIPDLVCKFTGLPRDWFRGKKVLDAGCGSGRFSYALASMGAEVTSIDQSESGLAQAKASAEEFGVADRITFVRHNLLTPLPIEPGSFDLVWSFGVLHHTGDTYKAFTHVHPAVKPGGYFFLMLYGEPRLGHPDDFAYRVSYAKLRLKARNLSGPGIVDLIRRELPGEDVHGWFDAISPTINDCYQSEEIEGWLLDSGFEGITRTEDMANHHLISRRRAV